MSAASGEGSGLRRTWRQDPQGRRGRVLEEAAVEFGQHGYTKARVVEIARRAEVAEGTVYHLFGSKRGLVVAVGERFGDGLATAAFAGLPADFHPRDIGQVVRNIFAYVRETRETLGAFLLSSESLEGGEAQAASRARMVDAIEATLELYLERGLIPAGAPAMHARIAAELQFSLIEGALKACFLNSEGHDEEAYITEATRSLASMLGVNDLR